MRRMLSAASCLFVICFFMLTGCVTEPAQKKPEQLNVANSLPQSKLAYYNDSFDELRDDIWEKSGGAPLPWLKNAKFADMDIEDGRLRIATKIGGFSRNGLGSNFVFTGDFDIQVDVHFDFLKKKFDMDQRVDFGIRAVRKPHGAGFFLMKKPSFNEPKMFSFYQVNGKRKFWKGIPIDNFKGTLRVVRIGSRISTLYKREGEVEWQRMGSFSGMAAGVKVVLALSNIPMDRTSIKAETSITAYFDNFRVNAAQGVREEDI